MNLETNRNTGGLENAKEIRLTHLPGYAEWLLSNKLMELGAELLRLSRLENLPLLRFFSSFSDKDFENLSRVTNTELLTSFINNDVNEYITLSTENFISNQLPAIERDEVLVEDITLISLVRRTAFRSFLRGYTEDPYLFNEIMTELDRFLAASESASFNAYLSIQQERINKINLELEIKRNELLEAQELADMGSFLWDLRDGNSQYTPGAVRILQLEGPRDLQSFIDEVAEDDREGLKLALNKAFAENGLFESEYTYIKNNIEKRIWSRGKIKFEDGKAVSMKGTVMDITKEYKLLNQIRQSEVLHKQAQALTHLGNWSWSIPDGKIIWSDEMYRIYGLQPQSEEISFDRFMSFVHPDARDARLSEIQLSLQTKKALDYFLPIIAADGTEKMLKGKGELILDAAMVPIRLNGTCQDITKEHVLSKNLEEKEQSFQKLISNAPDAVIVINAENIITLWNPKAEEIFGWETDEVVGKSLSNVIVPERYREGHEKGMQRYLSTRQPHILNRTLELSACSKNKKEIYISLTVAESMQDSTPVFIAFIRDISVQKTIQLELQKKTDQLELKNLELERSNEELESFNFAASHDLQEPLRKIQTYSLRIIEQNDSAISPAIAKDLDKIFTASARMQSLLQDLLDYSQNTTQSQELSVVKLSELIEEVKNSFIDKVEERKVILKLQSLPLIKVVRFQFLQLFMNLLSNAIKYQSPDVTPEIAISSRLIDAKSLRFKTNSAIENYLEISVTDNGIGFEAEYADRIFGLFKRLHSREKYAGTGIGLATCKKIIHNHGGFITAESIPGKGSTFFLYLPYTCVVRLQ